MRLEADCCLLCSSLSEDFFKVLVVFDGSTLANLLCYLGPYAFEEHQVVACVQVVNELLELGSLLYDLRSRLSRRLLKKLTIQKADFQIYLLSSSSQFGIILFLSSFHLF